MTDTCIRARVTALTPMRAHVPRLRPEVLAGTPAAGARAQQAPPARPGGARRRCGPARGGSDVRRWRARLAALVPLEQLWHHLSRDDQAWGLIRLTCIDRIDAVVEH